MSIIDIKKILLRLIFLFSLFSIFTQCTFLDSSRRSRRTLHKTDSSRLSKRNVEKKNFSEYIKIDIDNNGLVDSITYGRSPLVIALNYGDNKYKKLKFNTWVYNNKSVLDTVVRIGNENILILKTQISKSELEYEKKHKIALSYENRTKDGKYIIDSLTVKFGEIVSYKSTKSNKNYEIKEINFSYFASFIGKVYKIKIKSDRTLEYKRYRRSRFVVGNNNDYDEIKHVVLPKKFYKILIGLIQYADVLELKDNYSLAATDGDEATLSVLYLDGSHKKIKDYCLVGTINLRAIYKKMDEINRFFTTNQLL